MEVSLLKRWFPLIILVIFALLSIGTLNRLASNMAQKRDFYSDPLCWTFWDKTHQGTPDARHERAPEKPEVIRKGRFHEKRDSYRTDLNIFPNHSEPRSTTV
ncbi:hypothetical protein SAMN05216417_11230 [Nitrosospira multiformis]|uniref:Uncharacterized protein n=1 Tax=Nitrosospira multiformis TaxID=1231 RepID=A0A1I7HVT9_9PROT|nr:hypothetical protein SAMN05216417_11230 [Nitrosospira multiformis]